MGAAGWFTLRGAFHRQTIGILFLYSARGEGPTHQAIWRGAEVALAESTGRAGRYRVKMGEVFRTGPDGTEVAARIGTSEALLAQGLLLEPPFFVSVVDTHPHDPKGCFRVTPGCSRQGQAAAAWAKKSGASRPALLVERTSLRSRAIAAAFKASIPVAGEADVEDADRLLELKPDLIFFSGEEAPYSTAFKVFS